MSTIPVLVDITPDRLSMAKQGQPMIPLISADIRGMATTLLSAGVVYMDGDHASHAHLHTNTDVVVLLWHSGERGALTLYGERLEHEIWQLPQQALWIPRGVPHAAINPSRTERVVAFEFRSNPVLGDDNRLLPELDHVVSKHATRCRELQTAHKSFPSQLASAHVKLRESSPEHRDTTKA